MINKKTLIGAFFVFGILLTGFISAASISNPQLINPGISSSFLKSQGIGFPTFNEDMCGAEQDFLIQIAPFGCTPSIVRSDLLEEQNVPVFCQLSATQFNPLIDVQAIDSISFKGEYPKEVSGIGFYPARAAIRTSRTTLLNSPVLENIGYAVIVLRQQPKESEMPDFVEGNLTAFIRYDIENAFGIGKANYYLPELNNDDWSQRFKQYGFWNGKAYLKAEGIDEDSAVISVYLDEENRFSTFKLKKGQTSNDIFLPGLYCSAGLRIRLDGLENPDTRAKLNINGDIVEVSEREKFLQNECRVRNLEKQGSNQLVEISCSTDEGSERFELRINPKIKLEFEGAKEEGYNLGEKLPFSDDPNKNVYLGYVGTKGNSGKEEDLYIRFVQAPYSGDALSDEMLSEVVRYDKDSFDAQKGGILARLLQTAGEVSVNWAERFARYLIQGTEISNVLGLEDQKDVYGTQVRLLGFAGVRDKKLEGEVKENHENAMKDYRKIIDRFPNEKENKNSIETFGEKALIQAINLADSAQQKKTMVDLCKEFEERYPNSETNLPSCKNDLKISNSAISEFAVIINGKTKVISFEGIYEPTPDEYSVDILIRNVGEKYSGSVSLRKNARAYFSDSEFIELKELNNDYALFDVSSVDEGALRNVAWKTNYLKIELNDNKVIGENNYEIRVSKINLKKVAKVSVLPNIKNAGTEASFSFNIGIEKRAIQLSPEKINEKIEILNKSIEKWEGTSETLGTAVKGFNAACLTTGAALTVKNFFSNIDGKSIARKEVMRSEGGWMDICKDEIAKADSIYSSLDNCLLENSDQIDSDVETVYDIIQGQKAITDESLCGDLGRIRTALGDSVIDPRDEDKKIDISDGKDIYTAFEKDSETNKCEKISLTQAKDLERLNMILDSEASENFKRSAEISRYKVLSNINENVRGYAEFTSLVEELKEKTGLEGVTVQAHGSKDSIKGNYGGGVTTSDGYGSIPGNAPVQAEIYNNENYLFELQHAGGNKYTIKNVYDTNGNPTSDSITVNEIKRRFSEFIKYDSASYENKFLNPQVRYYETAPYKGLPALVPFDTSNGWYSATKQTLSGFGNIRAYDESGRVSSFWICNVGENGRAEFNQAGSGIGDDICQQFNPGIGSIYGEFPGLNPSETNKLVSNAMRAIEDASKAYKPGLTGRIKILNELVYVGPPAVEVPDVQCQDFMSPKDCLLLFNACDPVVCPSSRCNLGGTYYVSDVVQSGIIGSTILCLPNIKEKIVVPVCLSGIKAGVDSLVSVQKNYRDCLQENLDTGETIGICDEIHSIYLCDFFWEQAAPFSQVIIPKIFEFITGQGSSRGGGEYLGVQSAWQNAQNSVNYITQYYAGNSFEAFKVRATEGIGKAVCRNFVSATYPSDIGLDALIEPRSPPQYTAWFSETTFTTATVPATSQYKVFYHIYAGENSLQNIGAYYSVFLKSPAGTSFYQTNPTVTVASGYITKGDYASETKDFTAPSGYNELCIRVNAQEECGYKKVSTDFAINYVNDLYLQEQASQTNINTETACVSGTPSLYSLINPNIQAGVSEAINPELYNQGIIRICSSDNPGKNTDARRWEEVGTCDQGRGDIKCYIDTQSIKNVIKSIDLEDQTLKEIEDNVLEKLLKEGEFIEDFEGLVSNLESKTAEEKIREIPDKLIQKAFYNAQKAKLLLIRGNAYAELVGEFVKKINEKVVAITTGGDTISTTETTGEEEIAEDKVEEIIEDYPLAESLTNSQIETGNKILEIVKGIKTDNLNIDFSKVKEDTGIKSFECLVLQQTLQESSIRHCKKIDNEEPIYCDNNKDEVILGDEGISVGVMQINTNVHGPDKVNAYIFNENVKYGTNYLILQYGRCSDANDGTSNWEQALNSYNGLGCRIDQDYSNKVLSQKRYDTIAKHFGECR